LAVAILHPSENANRGSREPVGTISVPGHSRRGRWGATESTEGGDKLDGLLTIVESYEARRRPIEVDETFDPVHVLRYAIDKLGHTHAELAELPGSRSRASQVLSRRRAVTVEMIHKIGRSVENSV
jgi:antitoxin component HigA of HigAB toxin-antitoxin module